MNVRFVEGTARIVEGFSVGAKVLIDQRVAAVVRAYFPTGSSSYMFPHYKVDICHGDQNVAVAVGRVSR